MVSDLRGLRRTVRSRVHAALDHCDSDTECADDDHRRERSFIPERSVGNGAEDQWPSHTTDLGGGEPKTVGQSSIGRGDVVGFEQGDDRNRHER